MNKQTVWVVMGLGIFGFAALWWWGQGQAQPTEPSDELVALAQRVNDQIDRALEEASLAWVAANFEDVKVGTQRVLNVLVGQGSPDYGPIEGGGGDLVGALENIAVLKLKLEQTPWADFAVTASAMLTFAEWARANVKAVLAMADEEAARVEVHKAEAFLRAALGCGEGLPTSGGAKTILEALRTS